ncbi:hypothetical protein FTV88_3222 [Heliorestis convoluta]|uniref:Uncharacterized protein n=1 Tax=Heliorestis convoluta TaxID=356322 RepID=A0A5Q2N2R3_9FIRM|nr:hypothetical protein FTV88_3222 [Heliorestis convoluta]
MSIILFYCSGEKASQEKCMYDLPILVHFFFSYGDCHAGI